MVRGEAGVVLYEWRVPLCLLLLSFRWAASKSDASLARSQSTLERRRRRCGGGGGESTSSGVHSLWCVLCLRVDARAALWRRRRDPQRLPQHSALLARDDARSDDRRRRTSVPHHSHARPPLEFTTAPPL